MTALHLDGSVDPFACGDAQFLDHGDGRLVRLRPTLRSETGGEAWPGSRMLVCLPFAGITTARAILFPPEDERADTVENVRIAIARLAAVDPGLADHFAAALRATDPDDPPRPPNVFD